jgi:electron transfer flavoprotein beta subunit
VGIRGIRKVASVEIPVLDGAALGLSAADLAPRTQRLDYFVPVAGAGAEMLAGGVPELAAQLVELLRVNGGLN